MKKSKRFTGHSIALIAAVMVLVLASCPGDTTGADNSGPFFTVTYHANGEDVTVPAAQKALPGTAVYIATLPGYNPDTAAKVFQGWNTEADGSGGIYTPGAALKVEEDIDLYAEWTDPGEGSVSAADDYTVVMQPMYPKLEGPTVWYGILIPDFEEGMVEPHTDYSLTYSFTSNVGISNLLGGPADASGEKVPTGELVGMIEEWGAPNIRYLCGPMTLGSNITANTEVSGIVHNTTFSDFTANPSELANCIIFYTSGTVPEQPTLTFTKLTLQKTEWVKVDSSSPNGDASGNPTSQISITFDKPVYNLEPEDFLVYYLGYLYGGIKIDSVVGSGVSYILNIITPPSDNSETMDVKIVLAKYEGVRYISASMNITLYTGWVDPPPPPPSLPTAYLKPLTANGDSYTTTSQLIVHVSEPMSVLNLTSADIKLSGMPVTKGILSGGNEFDTEFNGYAYFLPISGFTTGGNVTVSIEKDGWNIIHNLLTSTYTTTVYYGYENVTYTGFLGKGYDVLNSAYYNSDDVSNTYALNMKKLIGEGKFVSDPEHFKSTHTDYIKGETMEKYAKDFSLQTKLSASVGFFKTSVSFNYSTSSSIESHESFATSRSELIRIKENLSVSLADLRANYLDDTFKNGFLLNNLKTPKEVFQNYGTHIFLTAYIGGRLDMGFIYHNETQESASQIEAHIKASYLTVSGEASSEQKEEATKFTSNSSEYVKSEGGSVGFGMNSYANALTNYANWANSVENSNGLSLVKGGDLDTITEMVPLWELIDPSGPYASRRSALKAEYDAQLTANGGLIFGLQKATASLQIYSVHSGASNNSAALAKSDLMAKSTREMNILDVDLNKGAKGAYIYLGYTETTNANEGVADLKAFYYGSNDNNPPLTKVINGITYHAFGYNLNHGTKGGSIYLYAAYVGASPGYAPLKELYVEDDGQLSGRNGTGWERVKWTDGGDANMNYYAGGSQIYIWMRR